MLESPADANVTLLVCVVKKRNLYVITDIFSFTRSIKTPTMNQVKLQTNTRDYKLYVSYQRKSNTMQWMDAKLLVTIGTSPGGWWRET